MAEGRELTPRERTDLTPTGGSPPTAVDPGTPLPEGRPWRSEGGAEILRSALGLLIGLAATGIGALLAEVTASRSASSDRH